MANTKDKKGTEKDLIFVGRVLDNVHGFIQYTDTERQIIEMDLFKRLQSIKQLSIVNWVFPGSEHTRYIHSLGVMYIADKIALQLGLTLKERKILRLAGLLHDIGHYPLSHVGEFPYKKHSLKDFYDNDYCQSINNDVISSVNALKDKNALSFMTPSVRGHHEAIGAEIVLHDKKINKLITDECGRNAPDIIASIITGSVENQKTKSSKFTIDPLLVQIIHSELDADGIDYLMRDAVFSGTSFGSFEMEQLIGCMDIGYYNGKRILCINPKGIAAADQYFMNKFFSFSQVLFNKHVSITEWMAEQIVNWMQKNEAYFPSVNTLLERVRKDAADSKYIDFTDHFFWKSLQETLDNPLRVTAPTFIKYFCSMLLHHSELEYETDSEVRIIASDTEIIKKKLMKSASCKSLPESNDKIGILLTKRMTNQIKREDFERILTGENDSEKPDKEGSVSEEDKENYELFREKLYMECVCVLDEQGLRLLCDDDRSLMSVNYNLTLAVLRKYKYDTTQYSS